MEHSELWQAYWEDPSGENKNELVLQYLGVVRSVVRRMMPIYGGKVEFDDLLSNGIFGLMDAIEKFDGDMGFKFETYAGKRIRGEILDYLRKQDWISTSMRGKINAVKNTRDTIYTKSGKEPSEEEIAKELDWDISSVRKALVGEYNYNIVYFEQLAMGDMEGQRVFDGIADTDDNLDPEKNLDKKDSINTLASAIELLPKKERKVIELYYGEELLLREIAGVLGVTESRVSQIHAKALTRLRGAFRERSYYL